MKTPKHKSLGEFLQAKRLEKDYSQGDLAKKLGYTTNQFVSNWERGLCSPPLDALDKVISLLQINRTELVEIMLDDSRRILEEKLNIRKTKKKG